MPDSCVRRKTGTATNSRLWNWLAVPGLPPGFVLRRGILEDADVVEIAISLGVVQTVAHHELVGDFEPHVADVHGPQAALGLIQEGGDAYGVGLALIQHVH